MKVKVYQIGRDRDNRGMMFVDYARTVALGGVDPDEYECTFNGDLNVKDLEDVYSTFNISSLVPKGYHGRSLSVSDVVVTPDGAFFVDRIGFKKLDFDERFAH